MSAPESYGGRSWQGLKHQVPQEVLAAQLIVLLIHIHQQLDGLMAHGLLERVCDEDALEGLQQGTIDVVAPEGVEVGELREFDVADDGAQVPGLKDGVGLVEALELALQWLLLVGEDVALQGRLMLAVLSADPQPDIYRMLGGYAVSNPSGR